MKKKASYEMNLKDIKTKVDESNNMIKDIIAKSIYYVNEANKSQIQEIEDLIELAEDNGYYPFVTKYLQDLKFQAPILENYDEYIFYINIMQQEKDFFDNTNEDTRKEILEKLNKVKEYL